MVRAIQPSMKPTAPMRGGWHSRLKPMTPLHGSNHPKQAHSHPQRRHRFHQRPPNTTDLTTTRPHTARRETHSTNARRLALALETRDTTARRPTLALETRDTTARLQPPKTGPFTPAKATPVSPPPPTKPAKATPVSQASQPHCHLELRPAQNRLSFTGSGRHPRKGGTLAAK